MRHLMDSGVRVEKMNYFDTFGLWARSPLFWLFLGFFWALESVGENLQGVHRPRSGREPALCVRGGRDAECLLDGGIPCNQEITAGL